MSIKITTKKLLIFLLTASIFALTFAYISQFVFGFQPCILCLHQRKPFFGIIALTTLALIFFKKENLQKIAFFFCIIFLLINSGIATYHVGVEQKIFHGPTVCSSQNLDEIQNLAELEKALLATKAVRCDEPEFFFLKLSMAAWNLIFCTALAVLSLLLLRRKN